MNRRCAGTFVAVSTNAAEVARFGIDTANMFGFWDWVGGRYSMESAIGLSTMIAIGPNTFARCSPALLRWTVISHRAAHTKSARSARFTDVWYTGFFGAQSVAVLPYDQYLKRFPAYLQQLTMESNGKHVTIDGARVDYPTAPVIWGEPGPTDSTRSISCCIRERCSCRATSSVFAGP
jgi:glucose-6-phosphate isomerase